MLQNERIWLLAGMISHEQPLVFGFALTSTGFWLWRTSAFTNKVGEGWSQIVSLETWPLTSPPLSPTQTKKPACRLDKRERTQNSINLQVHAHRFSNFSKIFFHHYFQMDSFNLLNNHHHHHHLLKFKFNKFLNLYNPHIALLIEAGCITYNKIH